MYSIAFLTEDEAKIYQVVSISSFLHRPGSYFATLKAAGKPNIVVKLEYRLAICHADSFYARTEIRGENNKVIKVRFDVEEILGDKVKKILATSKAVEYETIKKEKEKETACL